MKTTSLFLAASLTLGSFAQVANARSNDDDDEGEEAEQAYQPQGAPPAQVPSAIPQAPPPPTDTGYEESEQAQEQAEPVAPAPPPQGQSGQWVSTAQYGWIYVPYSSAYTYAPDYGTSYSYVYYPSYGDWRWVSAPWIWGIGVRPYFCYGPRYYSWYRPTYWNSGYRWGQYYGGYGPGFRGGPT